MGTPKKIGQYAVERPLGEGGMATALLARHSGTGERVVLKVPHNATDEVKDRVRDEARTGIRLSHPNIVETLDLVEHEGKPVLVVRFIEGCALKDWWSVGPAPVAAVCHIGTQVADALAAIHEATDERGFPLGTLHRDVAPGNILVTTDGDAMLIDLGIARSIESKSKRTEVGVIKGTLRYLAPDILEGKPHSAETDLWALGVCLWEAALGRRAVVGDDRTILSAVVHGKLLELKPSESIDPALLSLLQQLLGKPGARFTKARAAAAALRQLRDTLGGAEAAASAARAWVARCPQSDNVGEGPDPDGAPPTVVDGSIARALTTVREGRGDWDDSTGSKPHITRGADLDAPLSAEGAAPTVRISVVDEAALRAHKGSAPPSPRAVTFGQMPASDPGRPAYKPAAQAGPRPVTAGADARDTLPEDPLPEGTPPEDTPPGDTLPGDTLPSAAAPGHVQAAGRASQAATLPTAWLPMAIGALLAVAVVVTIIVRFVW